jgi:hypothetical protein
MCGQRGYFDFRINHGAGTNGLRGALLRRPGTDRFHHPQTICCLIPFHVSQIGPRRMADLVPLSYSASWETERDLYIDDEALPQSSLVG